MSGKRIDDHKFFAGGPSKDSVLPKGVHVKHEMSDGHAGTLSKYEDTTEMIKAQQQLSDKKVKGHPYKEHYRN